MNPRHTTMLNMLVIVLAGFLALFLPSRAAWGWFYEGHQVVAIIAAAELTANTRSHVAQILGVLDDEVAMAKAMAAASIRPDTEFREQDKTTAAWHYIDICLEDHETDIPARCPQGNFVTAKIDEYAHRLRDGNYDRWGAAGDLAFLIHFVGDLHQPLHAATNADRGGRCQQVNVVPAEANLHYAWDDAVVASLEQQLGTNEPEATVRKLEARYPATGDLMTWKAGESEQIAWESHRLAESIGGSIEVTPTVLHTNIGLIDPPGFVGRLEMTAQSLFQCGTITLHPTPDRRVICLQAALGEQLFDIAQ